MNSCCHYVLIPDMAVEFIFLFIHSEQLSVLNSRGGTKAIGEGTKTSMNQDNVVNKIMSDEVAHPCLQLFGLNLSGW